MYGWLQFSFSRYSINYLYSFLKNKLGEPAMRVFWRILSIDQIGGRRLSGVPPSVP
jgi:hypothetical protein